ncbi:hypothetical protein B0H13DRAFT_2024203 [Mycena leptocephala]|nr:hypothetical protein B0H13DRAFT_2024203 [Mycena leptocephala]
MATQQNQEFSSLPDRIDPMSASGSQSSQNPEFEPTSPSRHVHPDTILTRHPDPILTIRTSESPQPLSASADGRDGGPDGGSGDTRPKPMSDVSFLLPQHPEDAQRPPLTAPGSFQFSPVAARSEYRPGSQRRTTSEIDWIVPKREQPFPRPRTLQERLQPTLDVAEEEKIKCEWKAQTTGYALNIAIGLQVLLGALTTGLSAAISGRKASIGISFLGGASTVVASFLARQRGSNEPELSLTKSKDLDQYIRECKIFILDHGHLTGTEHDAELKNLRDRYEELMGNGNGERRLAPV